MRTNTKKRTTGFTLVETLITITILSIAAFGITSTLINIQYKSQDSLYGSTALTVAISTLEQMKSTSVAALENNIGTASFNLITGVSGTTILRTTLSLGRENTLQIPIVTNTNGDQTIPLTLIPNIHALANNNGFLLEVRYEYEHPRNNRPRTETVRAVVSRISNY